MNVGSIKDINNEVTDYTVNGECSNCGECCSDFLPLYRNDVSKIKKYLKSRPMIKPTIRGIGLSNLENSVDLLCPFRDDINKCCKIYPVRPLICKFFQCNKSTEEIAKKFYRRESEPLMCSMRATFFGDK